MSETRERLGEFVAENPGIHFNGLVRKTDLAAGQVQHHLRRLTSAGTVVREDVAGRSHYYPTGYDEWERGTIALLRRETTREVVACLLEQGPSAPAVVADEIDVARSTLEWHLDSLEDHDVVRKLRDERGRVTLALARPEATIRLLETVAPSLPASMVDRFTRLVDHLLE